MVINPSKAERILERMKKRQCTLERTNIYPRKIEEWMA